MKKLILIGCMVMATAMNAYCARGKVTSIVMRISTDGLKFNIENNSTTFFIKQSSVGAERFDRLFTMLLASQTKGLHISFDHNNPNDVVWLELKDIDK